MPFVLNGHKRSGGNPVGLPRRAAVALHHAVTAFLLLLDGNRIGKYKALGGSSLDDGIALDGIAVLIKLQVAGYQAGNSVSFRFSISLSVGRGKKMPMTHSTASTPKNAVSFIHRVLLSRSVCFIPFPPFSRPAHTLYGGIVSALLIGSLKSRFPVLAGPCKPRVNHPCISANPQKPRGSGRSPPALRTGSARFARGFRLRRKGLRPAFPRMLFFPQNWKYRNGL